VARLSGATGTTAKQHRLLLVQFKAAYPLHGKLQHLESGTVQVKEFAAILAHQNLVFVHSFSLSFTD
jgi:hypothetical protein